MFSRTVRNHKFLAACPNTSLSPTFLLPLRARLSATTNTIDPNPLESSPPSSSPPSFKSPSASNFSPQTSSSSTALSPTATPYPSSESSSIPSLLPLLAAQRPHYIIAHLHSHPYLLTCGDTLRLPFHMPAAPPGTVLRLTRASAIGSRDYTFRGQPWVDEKYFVCRARVVGVEGEPMRVEKKTKRRQRKVKTIKNKMRFTVVRCFDVRIFKDGDAEQQKETEDIF